LTRSKKVFNEERPTGNIGGGGVDGEKTHYTKTGDNPLKLNIQLGKREWGLRTKGTMELEGFLTGNKEGCVCTAPSHTERGP